MTDPNMSWAGWIKIVLAPDDNNTDTAQILIEPAQAELIISAESGIGTLEANLLGVTVHLRGDPRTDVLKVHRKLQCLYIEPPVGNSALAFNGHCETIDFKIDEETDDDLWSFKILRVGSIKRVILDDVPLIAERGARVEVD